MCVCLLLSYGSFTYSLKLQYKKPSNFQIIRHCLFKIRPGCFSTLRIGHASILLCLGEGPSIQLARPGSLDAVARDESA